MQMTTVGCWRLKAAEGRTQKKVGRRRKVGDRRQKAAVIRKQNAVGRRRQNVENSRRWKRAEGFAEGEDDRRPQKEVGGKRQKAAESRNWQEKEAGIRERKAAEGG